MNQQQNSPNKGSIPLEKVRTILFDMDGTLVDTEKTASFVIAECFTSWGLTLQQEDLSAITGVTWRLAAQRLYAKYPSIPVSPEEAFRGFKEKYRERLEKEGLVEVPGARDAVRDLAKHFPLALVSGSLRQEISFVLERLKISDCFEAVFGAEDYPHSKPAPDGFQKAMLHLDSTPQETLIFEDSWAGVQSGRAAGAWVVGITSAHHFPQDISDAHLVLPDFTKINRQWFHRGS